MAERKESSVLFSLRELRSIEDERIAEEESARRRADEDRRRAVEDAERRTREAEDARRQAIEAAERQSRDEIDRRDREERLRVEEAERRARVEAQANIEQQRMAKEMEIRAMQAQRTRPTALIAIAAILVLAVGGLGFFAYNQMQKSETERKAQLARFAELEKQIATTQDDLSRLSAERDAEFQKLLAADTEEEKAAHQREMDQKARQIADKQNALKKLRDRARDESSGDRPSSPRKDDNKIKTDCDPNDPLCGIN